MGGWLSTVGSVQGRQVHVEFLFDDRLDLSGECLCAVLACQAPCFDELRHFLMASWTFQVQVHRFLAIFLIEDLFQSYFGVLAFDHSENIRNEMFQLVQARMELGKFLYGTSRAQVDRLVSVRPDFLDVDDGFFLMAVIAKHRSMGACGTLVVLGLCSATGLCFPVTSRQFAHCRFFPALSVLAEDDVGFGPEPFFVPFCLVSVGLDEGVWEFRIVRVIEDVEIEAELRQVSSFEMKDRDVWPAPGPVVVQVGEALVLHVQAGVSGKEIPVDKAVPVEMRQASAADRKDVLLSLDGTRIHQPLLDGWVRQFGRNIEICGQSRTITPPDAQYWHGAIVSAGEHFRRSLENTFGAGRIVFPLEHGKPLLLAQDAVVLCSHELGVDGSSRCFLLEDRPARDLENHIMAWFCKPCVQLFEGGEIAPRLQTPTFPALLVKGEERQASYSLGM